ncbi:hypothetical protein PVAP13_2NG227303 [Panicum virgatum]|uniref:Uncharacterized protein n=1 Tax=Panicum virgatum TaxID=38727 RepID=A0A8T0VPK0_PANVG|nr:hypothetical protein PVAP13_2NG227303 [Panicum virgatum]
MKVTSLSWSVHCCWARSRTPGRMLMFTGLLLNHFGLFEARMGIGFSAHLGPCPWPAT